MTFRTTTTVALLRFGETVPLLPLTTVPDLGSPHSTPVRSESKQKRMDHVTTEVIKNVIIYHGPQTSPSQT